MSLSENCKEAPRSTPPAKPGKALVFPGTCDVSAGVALTSEVFVVADDENNVLRFYDRRRPALPVKQVDMNAFLRIDPEHPEADIEAATRVGNVIYWITSHGRNRDGKPRPNRYRFFATAVRTSGQEVSLEPLGRPCDGLIRELAQVTAPSGLHLDAAIRLEDRLKKKERQRLAPKEQGLNIEGLAASADGRTLYIGLRNPLARGRALLIPLSNARAVIESSARPVLGPPLLWDLGRRGIRSMEYCPQHRAFLIVAGPIDDETGFVLYRWSGHRSEPPVFLRVLDTGLPHFTPEALIPFPDEADVLVLSDDGTVTISVSGPQDCIDKDEYDPEHHTCPQKYLADQNRKTFRGVFLHF